MAKLYFRHGAMGSSKTANALMVEYNYYERGKKALLLKPQLDNRDGEGIIKSRMGLEKKCNYVENFVKMSDDEIKASDCVIVDLGNAHMPYPVFLADDGILAYIDIAQCAQAGAFFMTEPMYGIEHINRFEEEAGNVFIERKSGEKINLQECLDIAVNNSYPGFIKQLIGLYDIEGFILNKTVGDESIPQYYFGFDSEDESRFLLQDYVSDEHRMEGSLSYIGTDENGMVLSFIFNRDNDEDMPEELWKKGLWNLKEDGYWDDEAGLYYSYLYLTPISGDDIFDNNMETVKMEKSYG